MTKNILSRFAGCLSLAAAAFFACAELPEDCGSQFINSKTQFCLSDQAYERCGGKEFSPYNEFCHDNVVFSKCNGVAYTPPDNPCGEPSSNSYRYSSSAVPSSGSQERSSVSQVQSSSSAAPRDVPSSSSAVQSSGSKEPSSSSSATSSVSQVQSSSSSVQSSSSQVQSSSSSAPSSSSQGQSSSSSATSSSSQGQSSSSSATSSCSQVQSSSSSAPSSSSSAPSSSSLASSSSAIPDPIATGELAFKNFDFSVGGSYYIGTNVTIEDNIASTVAVSNADDAGCGDVKIELSGCGAPGAVTTANANCTITAKAVVTCIKKHELKTVTATVVPNPSLNGSCTWEGGNALVGGTTASVTAEPALQNEYGRDCEGPYFSVGGERKSYVFAGLTVDEGNGSASAISGITIGATCAGKAVTEINCPNIAVFGILNDSRDDQSYRIVVIGTQTWMAENLNYGAAGGCYNNSSCDTYGRLYDYATAGTVCPSGWHLPSDAEWNTLTNYVGSTAGTKLKAKSGWSSGNGTDDYGFSALPGGYCFTTSTLHSCWSDNLRNIGNSGYWWSATQHSPYYAYAYYRIMSNNGADVSRSYDYKEDLLSVRCVQN